MTDARAPCGLFVGRSTFDLVYAMERYPERNTKAEAIRSYHTPGGPALTASVTFSLLGGESSLVSALGSGLLAQWVSEDLGIHGVRLIDTATSRPDALPVTTIILDGDARTIFNDPISGAAEPLDVAVLDGLPRPSVVLSDGHLPELAGPTLRWAREIGITTVFDGGSWKPWTEELLPFIDIAIVSRGFMPPGVGDSNRCVDWLLDRGVRGAVVTRESAPVLWSYDGQRGEVLPPAVDAIDTLGAGDVFHGAFCYQFALSGDAVASLSFAANAASRSCTMWGTRQWIAGPPT